MRGLYASTGSTFLRREAGGYEKGRGFEGAITATSGTGPEGTGGGGEAATGSLLGANLLSLIPAGDVDLVVLVRPPKREPLEGCFEDEAA